MAPEVKWMAVTENIIAEIKPSTAIRHNYNAFSKLCHETQAPIVVTKNGEADLVVMSFSAYQKMVARYQLGQMLSEVDREIAQGKPMRDFEDIFTAMEKRINHE